VILLRSHSSLWDFKMICTRTLICSLVRNKGSYLEHFAPIVIFFIYSVELELHDRKVYFRTYVRIWLELSYCSLENPRSNWVVVIDLELLSLACPSLGLGSCYVHQLRLYHPVIMMVILILLVWKNRIWGDRIGTSRCNASGSRLLSGAMLEACIQLS
jgi:hypothetical protein